MSSGAVRYRAPAGEGRAESVIKRSRFIGTAGPSGSAKEAMAFVKRVSDRFSDARHNAWAYKVGFGPEAQIGFHDDGEPGGSADRPILAAIERSGVGDVVVVVTRYFGGIKLGTGGLARAYGRTAGEALAALPTAERAIGDAFRIQVEYGFLDTLKRIAGLHEGRIQAEDFGIGVEVTVFVPLDREEGFLRALAHASGGKLQLYRVPEVR